jgi:hypothetical protein
MKKPKFKVTITFTLNPLDYCDVRATKTSVKEMTKAMLKHEADMPRNRQIKVEDITNG